MPITQVLATLPATPAVVTLLALAILAATYFIGPRLLSRAGLFPAFEATGAISFEIIQISDDSKAELSATHVTVNPDGKLLLKGYGCDPGGNKYSLRRYIARNYGGAIAGVIEQFNRQPEGLACLNGLIVKVYTRSGRICLFKAGTTIPKAEYAFEAYYG